jgi:hypothetical protein
MSDSRELAATGGGAVAPAAPSRSAEMLAMIRDLATNPEVDAGKMTALTDLAIKLQDREREAEYRRDKVEALLHKAVTPILAAFNMVISFRIGQLGNRVSVTPVLTHRNGYEEVGEAMPLDIDTTGSKNATQGAGSASQYGKRYALVGMLNIRIEGIDDDGVGAGGGESEEMTEQQQTLVAEAEIAAGSGDYDEWFSGRSAPERGWLVKSGRHASFRGEKGNAPRQATTDTPKRKTPREWVDGHVADVGKCPNVDKLDELLDRRREALTRLKETEPDLWARANNAAVERREALNK